MVLCTRASEVGSTPVVSCTRVAEVGSAPVVLPRDAVKLVRLIFEPTPTSSFPAQHLPALGCCGEKVMPPAEVLESFTDHLAAFELGQRRQLGEQSGAAFAGFFFAAERLERFRVIDENQHAVVWVLTAARQLRGAAQHLGGFLLSALGQPEPAFGPAEVTFGQGRLVTDDPLEPNCTG